MSRGRVCPCPI